MAEVAASRSFIDVLSSLFCCKSRPDQPTIQINNNISLNGDHSGNIRVKRNKKGISNKVILTSSSSSDSSSDDKTDLHIKILKD